MDHENREKPLTDFSRVALASQDYRFVFILHSMVKSHSIYSYSVSSVCFVAATFECIFVFRIRFVCLHILELFLLLIMMIYPSTNSPFFIPAKLLDWNKSNVPVNDSSRSDCILISSRRCSHSSFATHTVIALTLTLIILPDLQRKLWNRFASILAFCTVAIYLVWLSMVSTTSSVFLVFFLFS